jgi:hypothetical protein
MKMKAEGIRHLQPGSVIRINGVDWIRMADSGDTEGLNGGIFNPQDGDWMKWYALCFADDEVELIRTVRKGDV